MRRITAFIFALTLLGCEHNEKDSHTEVFKTPAEVVADRRAKQLAAHKDLAISVLKFARPDIQAKPADGTTILVEADGASQSIDILPIEEQLVRHNNEERAILRRYLETQLKPFDFERLKSLGVEQGKKHAGFELVNGQSLQEMQIDAGNSPIQSLLIVSNVLRITVIHRHETVVSIPVTAALLKAWKISPADIDTAAMQNLRDLLSGSADNVVDTLAFGPAGNSGSLKPGIDPAVILLPEFLTAVQKAWKTADNLVLFVPATGGIVFVEAHNQRLLDTLVPQWKKQLATSTAAPLSEQLLLRDSEKLALFAYSPATQPATVPTTKPKPYFVH